MKRTGIVAVVLIVGAFLVLHVVHRPPPLQAHASRILIIKSKHKLMLLDADDNVLRSYAISLGRGGLEPKQRQGDHKSPEGMYLIDRHKPDSRFHRALHVSYPNPSDRERAQRLGVDPGGDIMIHGMQNGLGWIGPLHRLVDWTDGCFAVTDSEVEDIYAAVSDGTPVEVRH